MLESLGLFTKSAPELAPVLSENVHGNYLIKDDIDDHIEFAVDNIETNLKIVFFTLML